MLHNGYEAKQDLQKAYDTLYNEYVDAKVVLRKLARHLKKLDDMHVTDDYKSKHLDFVWALNHMNQLLGKKEDY